MGQKFSCSIQEEHGWFSAVQFGDLNSVNTLLEQDPNLIKRTTVYDHHSALHIAAANGQIEIVTMLLENRSVNPDSLNRHKQVSSILLTLPVIMFLTVSVSVS
ncbi:putative ankyrin repeat-containing domain-containing protein [Helianthus debilis subsp. tardiflorus]